MLEDIKLTGKKSVPLYRQLENEICRQVKEGELKPGDKLPSERTLCCLLDISRMTVHRALDNLVQAGLLEKEQGSGTYVAEGQEVKAISPLVSLSSQIEELDYQLKTEIKEWQELKADQKTADKLAIKPGSKVYSFIRLREVAGEPLLLEKIVIPVQLVPGLGDKFDATTSLYKLLREEYQLALKRAEAEVRAVSFDQNNLSDKKIITSLKLSAGDLALYFDQLTYLIDDRPVEWNRAYYAQTKNIFKLKFDRSLKGEIQPGRDDC
ncbi:MAG: GntR family transcriptional regulator [Halanaerobiaceae bacterium]